MSVELRQAWDQRLERLLSRMPSWLHSAIQWLRVPSRWWIRGIAALIFILGGALEAVMDLWAGNDQVAGHEFPQAVSVRCI
jgi:hypothetical protein